MSNVYKIDKIAGFIYRALEYGYSYDDAWNLLLNSEPGKEILNNTYAYIYHIQGPTSFHYAVDVRNKERKRPDVSVKEIELLSEFIEFAHGHNISYEKMFKKESMSSFMNNCGKFLGNYDDKLLSRIY